LEDKNLIETFFYLLFFYTVFDGIYLYILWDKRILLNTSGSKIKILSKKSDYPEKLNLKCNYKKVLIKMAIRALIIISFYYLNQGLFYSTINQPFIPLNLFGKTLEVVSLFDNKWKMMVAFYNFALIIFLVIITGYINEDIIIVNFKRLFLFKRYKKEYYQNEAKKSKGKIVLGKDFQHNDVFISQEALYQNLCITGSIGSGKTSGAVLNIARQLIRGNIGGVILDIKGNMADKINVICEKEGRKEDLKVISSESNNYFELIPENVSFLEVANTLKQVISLISPTNNTDTYWLDKVENVLQNIFIIIEYYNKRKSLMELHKMITNNDYMMEKIKECKEKLLKGERYKKNNV